MPDGTEQLVVPVAELDRMTVDQVGDWFNARTADAQRTQMLAMRHYCEYRSNGEADRSAAELEKMFRSWETVAGVNCIRRQYLMDRQEKGLNSESASAKRGSAMEYARLKKAKDAANTDTRVKDEADKQRRSNGSVVKIDTNSLEYRLREKRWREMTKR